VEAAEKMKSAVRHSPKKYEELNRRFPLRPIHDDVEYESATEICDDLTDRIKTLTHDEHDYLEVLTDLIAKYESNQKEDTVNLSPRELIQFLMDENDLAQKDLIPELGTASRVSEFLSGQRSLSVEQAKRLAERFSLDISALIE
jgi:HTH-type transcriptional regulator / antitoxin HigA